MAEDLKEANEVVDDLSLEFWIDPGDASPEVVADVLIALSRLQRALGGEGLVFHTDGQTLVRADAGDE